jgi:preprotein translocase subunit SecA
MNAATQPSLLEPQKPPAICGLRLEQACSLRPLEWLPEGLDAYANRWLGRLRRVMAGQAKLLAEGANLALNQSQQLDNCPSDLLVEKMGEAREWLACDPLGAKGHLSEVLGTVGQLSFRLLGMRPHKVQYMGALALHRGLLAEMATGEGKTLTVALAGVLAGLSGRPCHVLTVNDYLADRDASSMSLLYQGCGISVAAIVSTLDHRERSAYYASDVVYLTAKEFLADYLRDELSRRAGRDARRIRFLSWLLPETSSDLHRDLLQVRGLHTAIVDEADSILIDEAVTPLILSAPRESGGLAQAVQAVSGLADAMRRGDDYQLSERGQTVLLTDAGRKKLERIAGRLPKLWRPGPRREELMRQALTVRHFFHAGEHYLVQDGEVVLLDTSTGRTTPGRTLSAGLHQAIEAFEGLQITDPNESLTQMSFQGFFRRFRRLSGCTGTAWESADEFWEVYGLQVVRIPTYRPRIVEERTPVVARSEQAKWLAVCEEVMAEHAMGRPVLVGVRSVAASEAIAELLRARGCQPAVLNALSHAQEAQIVATAGQPGAITIATNMAGRGTDIRLGEVAVQKGGLHVVIAEANDSPRVDRQLAGRCGRQGDPGSVTRFLALTDSIVGRYLYVAHQRMLKAAGKNSPALQARLMVSAFTSAQRRAEREAFERRLSVLRSDDWHESALPFAIAGSGGRL